MKHLRKYNEAANEGESYTWDELIFRIDSGETKLIRTEREDLIEYIEWHNKRNPDFHTSPICKNTSWDKIKNGMSYVDERFVFVYDEKNAPIAVISEYEMMNPFVFGDVIILPGHDSVTCYNKVTGEHTSQHIR